VLKTLGVDRTVETAGLAIGGGAGYPATEGARRDWIARYGADVGAERADVLLERYGTKAKTLIEALAGVDDAPLASAPAYTRGEIERIVRTEHVVHLADVFLRRTSLAFTGSVNRAVVSEISEIVSLALGWSHSERVEEEDAFIAELSAAHGVHLGTGNGSEVAALR
jgi:glycerol-3-phosphate dehydrogenase